MRGDYLALCLRGVRLVGDEDVLLRPNQGVHVTWNQNIDEKKKMETEMEIDVDEICLSHFEYQEP